MKKRFLSILLVLVVVLSCSFSAFAESMIPDEKSALQWYFQNQMLGVQKGTGVTLVCPNGDYKTLYTGGTLVTCPYDGEALVLADAGGVHAEKVPSGIGRKDLPGYASDDGTPSVSSDGGIIWQPTWDDLSVADRNDLNFWYPPGNCLYLYNFFKSESYSNSYYDLLYDKGSSDAVVSLSANSKASTTWSIGFNKVGWNCYLRYVAPIKGKYSILKSPAIYSSALDYLLYYNAYSYTSVYDVGVTLPSAAPSSSNFDTVYVRKCYWNIWLPKYKIIPYNSADKPTSQTNITINNNVWNGNIYTDNSTNLTYIYPEYTTINENNETVTNISNNPIIYNNETKQYYTYDTVTNNYYYITYEQQPATPTPSPSPSPSPAPTETPAPSESPAPTPTPDPGENPTPTPTPGGGTIITPGGDNPGSTSTPESGNKGDSGSSSWNPFKWLADLLKDIVEKILKAIWKLITSIFSFLLWLLSLAGKLFPFIPAQAITAITAGAVIVTVIRIIKFITGR